MNAKQRNVPVADLHQLGTVLKRTLSQLEEAAPEAVKLKPLRSVDEGIEVLGGTAETSRLAGVTMQSVSGWKTAEHFPADTFLLFKPLLEKQGYEATPKLWRMKGHE